MTPIYGAMPPLSGTRKYVDLCLAYHSTTTYIYVLQDSYRSLSAYVEKADTISLKYGGWSYMDSIHISGLFITYLELFVALRWCLETLFVGDLKQKKPPFFNEALKDNYKDLVNNLHIVDTIFWKLRNEIHHSQLPIIEPHAWTVGGEGREEPERIAGLFLPFPKSFKDKQKKVQAEKFFYGSDSGNLGAGARFIYCLNEHYKALTPFHDALLESMEWYSQQEFNRSIEIPLGRHFFISEEL